MTAEQSKTLIGAVSFEERSVVSTRYFLKEMGGEPSNVKLAHFGFEPEPLKSNLIAFDQLNLDPPTTIDRFNTESLWSWVWKQIGCSRGEIVVDATCLPRELLGMVLFAISVKRRDFERVHILYVSAPPSPGGYATQNENLPKSDRWLSHGVVKIRSILGFPGDFTSENNRHVIALAGHEYERLLEIIEFMEPTRLSISGELEMTSTSSGAGQISNIVARDLRKKIALPNIESIEFSANSIEDTITGLRKKVENSPDENIALVAMNTKLSFIGTALYALQNRSIRLVYAVPKTYNSNYCIGAGETMQLDITDWIKSAATIQVHSNR